MTENDKMASLVAFSKFQLTGNLLYPLGILFQRFLKSVLCNAANPGEEKRQTRSDNDTSLTKMTHTHGVIHSNTPESKHLY